MECIEKIVEEIMSSSSKEKTTALLKNIPQELKTQLFDKLCQKIFSMEDKGKALDICDICVYLAADTKDSSRLYQAYLGCGFINISLRFNENARNDLNKAIELLPDLGVDLNKGVTTSSPFIYVFIWLSDVEYIMGSAAEMNGLQDKALEHYRNALNSLLRLAPENKDNEAWYFEKLGNIYKLLKNFEGAIKNYNQAIKYLKMHQPDKKLYEIHISTGSAYQDWKKFHEAERCFNQAIDIAANIGDKEAEANGYLNLASLYFSKLNRFEDARRCIDRAMERVKDPSTAATALQIKGGIDIALGFYHDALECHKNAAEYCRSIGDVKGEALALSSVASDLSLMGRNEESIEKLENVLQSYTKLNDKLNIIITLGNIAQEKSVLGDYEDALNILNQMRSIALDAKNHFWEANSFILSGNIHLYRTHSLENAEICFNRALDKSFEADNQQLKVQSLIGLSSTYSTYFWKWSYREAEKIPVEDGKQLAEKRLINAEDFIKKAIKECSSSESMLTYKANAYEQLADVYSAQKKYSDAQKSFTKALKIYKKLGLRRMEATTLRYISMLLVEAKEPKKSLLYSNRAIKIFRTMGLKDEISSSLNYVASILYNSGEFERSKQILEKAVSEGTEVYDPIAKANNYMGLGAIYQKMGNEQLALSNFIKAIETLDTVRSKIASGDLKINFQGQESTLYGAVIRSFFLQGNFEKSLEYVERAKSRVLIEQIRTARLRKPQMQDEAMGKREEELLDELSASIKEGISGKRAYELDEELRDLWNRMEKSQPVYLEMKEYLSLRRGDSLKTSDINEILRNKENSAILEYYILKDRLVIYLISSKSDELMVYSKEVDTNLIRKCSFKLISSIEKQSREDLNNLLSEISSYLIDPIAGALKNLEHIHIVPHSFLHRLPIHVLPVNGKSMIDRYSISYSPSASVLKYCSARPDKKLEDALVIGGAPASDLIYTEIEAERISKILGCKPVIGKDATKEYIYSNIQEKNIVSFSCHAKFDIDNALNSYILLPNPNPENIEKLTARDLFKMKISAELVALSACETGKSDERPGDEMLGLVRSIIFAGAKSVLASLWRVNDLAAYITMTKFFEKYYIERLNKSQSLRAAQLYLRDLTPADLVKEFSRKNYVIPKELSELANKQPEIKIFNHIYFWSPFIIVGDWN